MDGGVRENVPWHILRTCNMDEVISVVFSNTSSKKCCKNIFSVLESSYKYLNEELYNYEMNGSGKILKIETDNINLLDYTKVDYMYKLGYEKAMKMMS